MIPLLLFFQDKTSLFIFPQKLSLLLIKVQSVIIDVLYSKSDGIHLYSKPCVLYLHVHMSIVLSFNKSPFFLHAYLVWEGYFYWFVMAANCFAHPLTMLRNVKSFDFEWYYYCFLVSLFSKIHYYFIWKKL
jgi:hypothetical protein